MQTIFRHLFSDSTTRRRRPKGAPIAFLQQSKAIENMEKPYFGQLVIGPPGSGKTTYCNGMQQLLRGIGRKVAVVNIDPANGILPYECAIDIAELITLSDVMVERKLGPNGALMFCMEYIEEHIDWLFAELQKYQDHYIIFDFPGQVELFTHHSAVKNIAKRLCEKEFRLCAVNLVDSHHCSDPGKFISALLTALSTMLRVELPQVNILSKADLIEKLGIGILHFNIDFYTDALDLSYLLDYLTEDPSFKKYKKLNSALVDLIKGYGLVPLHPLAIEDTNSALSVLNAVDKANGYALGAEEGRDIQALLSTSAGADLEYLKTAIVIVSMRDRTCALTFLGRGLFTHARIFFTLIGN